MKYKKKRCWEITRIERSVMKIEEQTFEGELMSYTRIGWEMTRIE